MKRPKKGDKVLVECYSSKDEKSFWLPATVTGIRSALDRKYRVDVKLDDGREADGAAPECVKKVA